MKKRVNVLVISLVHLLLAFSSPCTTSAQEVVRDIDGEILRSDARYFVVSPLQSARGTRRGPIPQAEDGAGDANFLCPSQVVQSPLKEDQDIPVIFKPKAPEQVEITESTSLNIEFYDGNVCNNTVWEVEGYLGTVKNPAKSTNGVTENPSTWF